MIFPIIRNYILERKLIGLITQQLDKRTSNWLSQSSSSKKSTKPEFEIRNH